MGDMSISRISKLWLDRDQMNLELTRSRRENHLVVLRCGDDVAHSRILQLSVLTAANLAVRCFPGNVRVVASHELLAAPQV